MGRGAYTVVRLAGELKTGLGAATGLGAVTQPGVGGVRGGDGCDSSESDSMLEKEERYAFVGAVSKPTFNWFEKESQFSCHKLTLVLV